ncbi:MAG: SDR family NAD(P)-dependent oxidoreductase [Polyangiaceae bacterium]
MNFAVVTGAGRGVGRSVALALADRGLDVALVGLHVESLEEVAAQVKGRGRRTRTVVTDVSKGADVDAMAKDVLGAWGAPTVVVNNAGIVHREKLATLRDEDWDRVVDVNLRGTFLVTRRFLGPMLEAKRGRFVALGSISSTLGTPGIASYCAAKWGVVGFAKALAEELRGTGLQSLAVLPGSIDTDMLRGSGYAPAMTPDDVARLVTYASLDAPDAMNGSAVEMFGP